MEPSSTQVLLRAHGYAAFVVGFFIVGMPLLAWRADHVLPTLPAAPLGVAVAAFVASGLLSYWSFWCLVTRGSGTAFPTDPPRRFVAAGPYRRVRNPMYVGNLGMVLALPWIFGSAGMLAYAVLLCLVTHWYVVRLEEPALVERFGAAYARYRAEVPRWRPRWTSAA